MTATSIGVGLVGASGRMGRRVAALLAARGDMHLAAAIDATPNDHAPDDAHALSRVDVVVDFSAPPACAALLPHAARSGKPYLVASTALGAADEAAIAEAAQLVPVLVAANLSIGVQVMRALVARAAALLGPSFDAELLEIHHRQKRDVPSGTASLLASSLDAARGPLTRVVGRQSRDVARPADELGVASLRGGDVAGEHTVYFLGRGERIEITHRATDASIFADGALRAAAWLVGRAPGRYVMADVLGLEAGEGG